MPRERLRLHVASGSAELFLLLVVHSSGPGTRMCCPNCWTRPGGSGPPTEGRWLPDW